MGILAILALLRVTENDLLLVSRNKDILVECLVPDFRANRECVATIANCGLDVFAHNIETVERLTPFVRDPRAG